jgi:hypothetical protein
LHQKSVALAEQYGITAIPVVTLPLIESDIKSLIEQYGADLVVMDMELKSLDQDLVGNITTTVIKSLAIPILAVPGGAPFAATKKVLFAYDLLNGVLELLLKRIKNLARRIGAEVEVLLINETVENCKAKDNLLLHTTVLEIDSTALITITRI